MDTSKRNGGRQSLVFVPRLRFISSEIGIALIVPLKRIATGKIMNYCIFSWMHFPYMSKLRTRDFGKLLFREEQNRILLKINTSLTKKSQPFLNVSNYAIISSFVVYVLIASTPHWSNEIASKYSLSIMLVALQSIYVFWLPGWHFCLLSMLTDYDASNICKFKKLVSI